MAERDVRLLRALRQADGPEPLSALAQAAGCTAGEVQAVLGELTGAGYELSHHPHLGIRIEQTPDRLIADDLQARLAGVELARRILVFEKTDSTNDVAARLASEGAPEGTVVFAETQTAGRGRLGRTWHSPSHAGLWFSVVLRPPVSARNWMRFTTWAAVVAAEALESFVARPVQIKWPNDLLIDGRKVTGILLEGHSMGAEGFIVAGLGVNVNQTEFPSGLRLPAVSLRQATGTAHDRMALAAAILRQMAARYPSACQSPALLSELAWERSSLRNVEVEVIGGDEPLCGVAVGLEEEGELRLRLADGTTEFVSTGELSVRPLAL